jgi:hypothetical protein
MRATALLPVVLAAAAACSSQPEMGRPSVPDRPEVQRPEGIEPEGLAEVRDTLGAQRAEAREMENATLISPNALSTHPTTPWYESVYDTVGNTLGSAMRFLGMW